MSLRQRMRLQQAAGLRDALPEEQADIDPVHSAPRRTAFLAFASDSESDSDNGGEGGDSSDIGDVVRDSTLHDAAEAAPASAAPAPSRSVDAPATPAPLPPHAPLGCAFTHEAQVHAPSPAATLPLPLAPAEVPASALAYAPAPDIDADDAELWAAAPAEDIAAACARAVDELLRPSERHLNFDAEVMRTLGAGAGVPLGAAAGEPDAAQWARHHAAQPAGAGRRKARYVTMTPEPSWAAPPSKAAGGMSFARTAAAIAGGGGGAGPGAAGGTFALEYSPEYLGAQAAFEAVAASADPALLGALLARVPFHLDALLAVAELQRLRGEHEAASASLRHAAFVVESAWHPAFRPWAAPCRMDVAAPPGGAGGGGGGDGSASCGRAWWRLMQAAGRAGAPRAAFELCRLLLQLAPPHGAGGDPLRALLAIDFYALRCGATRFVLDLTGARAGAGGEARALLTLRDSDVPATAALPSLAFSRALALFIEEDDAFKGAAGGGGGGAAHVVPTAAPLPTSASASSGLPAAMYADVSSVRYGATRSLARALLTFPHALLPLLTAGLGLSARDIGVGEGGGAAAATAGRRGGDAAAAAATHPAVVPPSRCAWAPVFRHRLFAVPAAERAVLRRRGWAAWGRADVDDADEDDESGGDPQRRGVTQPAVVANGADAASADAPPQLPPPPHTPSGWTPALEKLVDVFVVRHAPLWRHRDRVGFLYAGALAAMDAADAARDIARGEAGGGGAEAAAAAAAAAAPVVPAAFASRDEAAAEAFSASEARRSLFEAAPARRGAVSATAAAAERRDAVLRHYAGAVVTEFSDELTTIAADVLDGPDAMDGGAGGGGGLDVAPRPPGIWIGGAAPPRDLDLQARPALLLLFESLLPWTVIPGAPAIRDPLPRGL